MSQSDRKMGPVMLTALVSCNMMGSGVFLLPANLAEIGSIGILGWTLTAIGAMLLALVFSKLSLLYPKAGGPYAYARSGFGDYIGFQTVYTYWVGSWIGNIAIAVAAVGYLSFFFPGLDNPAIGYIVAIIVVWLFTSVNFFGAYNLGRFLTIASLIMLLPLLSTALFGWFWFDIDTFNQGFNVSHQSNFHAISHAASLTLWAFLGVESATVSTAITENPKRDIPIATTVGTLIAATAYILSTTVIMGIVPNDMLQVSAAPFSLAASLALGPLAGKIVSGCAVITCLASLGGWMLLLGQSAKAAADDKLFPNIFAKVNRYNVPVHGLLIAATLMSILLLMTTAPHLSQQFNMIVSIAVFIVLLPYLYSAVALGILSHRYHVTAKQFNRYALLALLTTCYVLWAMASAGEHIIAYGCLITLLSVPTYAWILWENRHRNIINDHVDISQSGLEVVAHESGE